jgi:heat shock protein HslJ
MIAAAARIGTNGEDAHMPRHIPTLVATTAIALLIPVGVLASETPAPSAPAASPATSSLPVEGMRWHLREYRAEDGGMAGASDGAWIRLDGGALTGSTGCNDLSGSYTLEDDTLTFTGIAPTEASCLDGDLVGQEMAVLARLPEVTSFAFQTARGLDATELALIDAADGNHLLFRSIQGQTWTPMYDGSEPMPDAPVTVRFETGMATGQGPCDTFSGQFTQDDLSIAIGPLTTAGSSCPDAELEAELLADLQLARSYMLEAGDLVLIDEQGAPIRTYTVVHTGF